MRMAFGLLVLEVKGGGIAHDAVAWRWTSRDRHKHDLLRWLKALPGWSRRWVPMTHGALFPDSARPATDLGPDAPLSILGNAYAMEHLGDWTRALLEQEGRGAGPAGHDPGTGAGGRAAGPGKAALEELVRRLAPRFQLPMPLGPALREDQRRIVELTEQQFRVLNQLARNR